MDEDDVGQGERWLNAESANWLKQTWNVHGPVEYQANLIAGPPGTPTEEAQRRVDALMASATGHVVPEAVKEELRRRGLTVPPATGYWAWGEDHPNRTS